VYVAKTRSRAKKRASAARPSAGKPRKKTAGKKKARRRTPKAAPAGLDLKKLRKDLELAVGVLSSKASKFKDPPRQILAAQNLMGRWASEIDEICSAEEQETCGPTMFIPLPPP
jgi:hypothetical protein